MTASADNSIRIWGATSAKEIAVLRGHDGYVYSAAFSPDGSRIVTTGSLDNTARMWDAASAKEIAVLRGRERYVYSAAFSPDGSRIVTASRDNAAPIWDAAPMKPAEFEIGDLHVGLKRTMNVAFMRELFKQLSVGSITLSEGRHPPYPSVDCPGRRRVIARAAKWSCKN